MSDESKMNRRWACLTFKGRYRPESEAGLRRHWNATREKAADRLKAIRAKQLNLRCEAVLSWTDYDTFNRRPVQVTGRCPNPKNGHPKFCVGHRHLVSPPPQPGERKWNPDGDELHCRVTGNIPRKGKP